MAIEPTPAEQALIDQYALPWIEANEDVLGDGRQPALLCGVPGGRRDPRDEGRATAALQRAERGADDSARSTGPASRAASTRRPGPPSRSPPRSRPAANASAIGKHRAQDLMVPLASPPAGASTDSRLHPAPAATGRHHPAGPPAERGDDPLRDRGGRGPRTGRSGRHHARDRPRNGRPPARRRRRGHRPGHRDGGRPGNRGRRDRRGRRVGRDRRGRGERRVRRHGAGDRRGRRTRAGKPSGGDERGELEHLRRSQRAQARRRRPIPPPPS
ncbi:hypothetical protein SNARM312S_06055 [Streptomyces narbonensis]